MTLTRFDETTQVKDLAAGLNANADVIEPHLTALNPHPQGRLSRIVSGSQDVILTAEQARHTQLVFTGVLTGNINVIVPAAHMVYHVQNLTTNLSGAGPFSLTLKTGSGSGVVIQQANLPDFPRIKRVLCDGSDIVWADGGQIVEDNLHESSPTNGYYIKYGNGTMICTSRTSLVYASRSMLTGTWTYPQPFVAVYNISVTAVHGSRVDAGLAYDWGPVALQSYDNQNAIVRLWSAGSQSIFVATSSVPVLCQAIGRWK